MLQLGDFVIDKRDLFVDNHPIWLIDTTNMLQKYERIDNKEHNGKPVHTAMNTVSAKLRNVFSIDSMRVIKKCVHSVLRGVGEGTATPAMVVPFVGTPNLSDINFFFQGKGRKRENEINKEKKMKKKNGKAKSNYLL